jgi:ribosome-associated protein
MRVQPVCCASARRLIGTGALPSAPGVAGQAGESLLGVRGQWVSRTQPPAIDVGAARQFVVGCESQRSRRARQSTSASRVREPAAEESRGPPSTSLVLVSSAPNHPFRRPTTIQAQEFARDLAQLAHNKQGTDIVILDVVEALGIADYFVIVSARNPRHAQAIAQELEYEMKHRGRPRLHAAGLGHENRWVLLDFGDVVVHVFVAEAREFYALEALWGDAPRLTFQPMPQTGAAASGAQ